jgi:hypothetical protein
MAEAREKPRAPSDITEASIPGAVDAPAGLHEIYEALVKKAEEAMRWYASRQQGKKRWARTTRVATILFGALTALIPSVITVLPEHLGTFPTARLNPVATMFGVLAGTMILLDKFYSFSSSWMRYVSTFQEIQANLDSFRVNWRKQVLKLNANRPPSDEQIAALYDVLEAFSRSINDSIRNETQAWVVELKGVLADIDKTVETQRAAAAALAALPARGGLSVTLAADEYTTLDEPRKWTLQLDNRDPEVKVGQATAAVPSLDPGIYRLRISGSRQGQPVGAEYAVSIKPGEINDFKVPKLG